MRQWIISIILLVASVVQAGDFIDSSLSKLIQVDTFVFGAFGAAGVISEGEKDFRVLLSSPSAINYFEKLYVVGNPQAKCYALVGIRTLNPERFRKLSSELLADETQVMMSQGGCIVLNETMSSVVKGIARGDYDQDTLLKKQGIEQTGRSKRE